MMKESRFVIISHRALKAGDHFDFRFQISDKGRGTWESFAVPGGIPLERGKKALAIRTNIHNTKDALFTGRIPKGQYGAGTLTMFDSGPCEILKYTDKHIVLDLEGRKARGIYHLVNVSVLKTGGKLQSQWILFQGALKNQ